MRVAGLIFSNLHDSDLPQLTTKRTMGAVPFGGRYRLIDFPLSAMVNAGLTNISVIAHHNYQSLMEHIGSGKDWDLARHTGGIRILPPYNAAYANPEECYDSRMQSLVSVRGLIERIEEEHVLCCDCDVIGTPDFAALIVEHEKSGAAITVAVEHSGAPDEGPSLHIWIAKTEFLREQLREAELRHYTSFSRDIVHRQLLKGKVNAYRFEGRFFRLHSFAEYHALHLLLTKNDAVRRELLENEQRPVYTRTLNSPPVKYGKNAVVSNALITDGCVIEGEVVNSVLFRGVRVGEGCVVKDAVLMEDCILSGNAHFTCGILDKNVYLGGNVELHGHDTLPFFVEEGKMLR